MVDVKLFALPEVLFPILSFDSLASAAPTGGSRQHPARM
jgi:hypothetical protein